MRRRAWYSSVLNAFLTGVPRTQPVQRRLLIYRWVWWLWMEENSSFQAKRRSSWSEQKGATKVFKTVRRLGGIARSDILSELLAPA
jgi:hypothetical protein